MMKTFALGLMALTLSACASIPLYHPAEKAGASGFSEQKLDANQYRVIFQGDASTPRHTVEDYLLFRAAELTDSKGYDYFVLNEKDLESETKIVTTRRPALYGRTVHIHDHPYYAFPYYAYGYDWGYPYDTETREYTRYAAIAYIEMHRGTKPAGNARAFNAAEVMLNLGPVDCWKTEPHDEGKCKLSHQ